MTDTDTITDELRSCPECEATDWEPAYPDATGTIRAATERCQSCGWQGYFSTTWEAGPPGWVAANESNPAETCPGQMWLRPDMEAEDE